MKTLDRLELAENTLIVFCSDNGPVLDDGIRTKPSRSWETTNRQGRSGVANIVSGKVGLEFHSLHVERKDHPSVSDEVVCTIDFASSFAALTGQSIVANGCRDSWDVSAALLGKPGAKGREHLLQQDNGSGKYGFRVGDWKLVRLEKSGGAKAAGGKQKRDKFLASMRCISSAAILASKTIYPNRIRKSCDDFPPA